MFKFIVLASFLALCHTAPLNENNPTLQPQLSRPSPINPDILGDPKPEEKIILLNDKIKEQQGALDVLKQKEQPQKRQAGQGSMNHDDCHILDSNKDQHTAPSKEKDAKDNKEKGIIKRAATNPETPQNTPEERETQNKPSIQPKPTTDEGCELHEDHKNSKREAEKARTTESPGIQSKGKTKPYVATKPENFSEKAKRQIHKEEEIPTSQPQPEQPDEANNKKIPPKQDISARLTAIV